MEHLIAQFNSTGMIVLLVTSAVGIAAAVSLVITDYLEDKRRIKTAQKARQALREGRLSMLVVPPEPVYRWEPPLYWNPKPRR